MNYRRILGSLPILLPVLFICRAAEAQIPIFGPEQLTRGTGAPVTHTRSFTAPDISQPYTIRIQNGSDQATRVSSAEIAINGATVFGKSEFKKTIEVLERKLQLATNNELTVRLTSDPGSFLVVTVFAQYAATGTVGIGGGSIEVTAPGSPIYGTKLVIPPNAIPPNLTTNITVNFSDTLPGPLPTNAQQASRVFLFEKTMPYNFTVPITVTIPLSLPSIATTEMPVCYAAS
jgi:hypothetical protein